MSMYICTYMYKLYISYAFYVYAHIYIYIMHIYRYSDRQNILSIFKEIFWRQSFPLMFSKSTPKHFLLYCLVYSALYLDKFITGNYY